MFAFAFGIKHLHAGPRRQNGQVNDHDVASVGVVEVALYESEGRYLVPPALLRPIIEDTFPFPWVDYFYV